MFLKRFECWTQWHHGIKSKYETCFNLAKRFKEQEGRDVRKGGLHRYQEGFRVKVQKQNNEQIYTNVERNPVMISL